MRHYVVVFLESGMFPGTWITDHFVRQEEREDIPELPETLRTWSHSEAIKLLQDWQNVNPPPSPSWTVEECLLGRVARLSALWYGSATKDLERMVHFQMVGKV